MSATLKIAVEIVAQDLIARLSYGNAAYPVKAGRPFLFRQMGDLEQGVSIAWIYIHHFHLK
jgi:hypothetical protein